MISSASYGDGAAGDFTVWNGGCVVQRVALNRAGVVFCIVAIVSGGAELGFHAPVVAGDSNN